MRRPVWQRHSGLGMRSVPSSYLLYTTHAQTGAGGTSSQRGNHTRMGGRWPSKREEATTAVQQGRRSVRS